MGNCQAIDAAALVIQHPNGRIERMYWSVSAGEVMRMNPGHYVSLIIPLPLSEEENSNDPKTVRFTRVKLLRPTDNLVLGHAYRLITSQEVLKVLKAKKYAKMKKHQTESADKLLAATETEAENTNQATNHERPQPRTTQKNSAVARSKSWRPSLQSISEAAA